MSKKKQSKKHSKKLIKKEVHHQVHETESQKQHKEKKQDSHVKTPHTKKSFTFSPLLKKISNIVFVGAAILFMIGFLAFFILVKMREPTELSSLLPANDTVAFVELHATPFSRQGEALRDLTKDIEAYDPAKFTQQLSTWLGVNAETEIMPWVDTSAAGMAVLTNNGGEDIPEVYFLAIKDQTAATKFFADHTEDGIQRTTEDGAVTNPFPWHAEWRYAFIKGYVLVGTSEDALQRVIAVTNGKAQSVRYSELWGQVEKNLPSVHLGIGFINFERAVPLAVKVPELVTLFGRDLSVLAPLTEVFPAAGFTVSAKNDDLIVQSFTVTRRSDNANLNLEEYQGALASVMPQHAIAFFGGEDFAAQFDAFTDLFTSVHPSGAAIVEGMVRAQVEQLFGAGDLLESDIKPLLSQEYGIGFFQNDGTTDFMLVVSGDSDKELAAHADALKQSFVESGAVWQPVITEVTLPDGTTGRQIQAEQEPIVENSTEVAGTTVYTLSFGKHDIFYAMKDKKLFVSSAQSLIESVLNGATDQNVENTLQPYIAGSQEATYVDLSAIFDLFGDTETGAFLKPYGEPFQKMVITKTMTTAGATSVAHILRGE